MEEKAINDRIKQLRLLLGCTQEEFGKKLGVTRSAISYLESGRSRLTEHMLFMICATFNVHEYWLRTGNGEIFKRNTINEDLAYYISELISERDPEKEKYALIVLKLIIDEWDLIKHNTETINKILTWIVEKPKE